MIRLSKRLAAAAAFVPANCRPVDVGTDHAALPIYLVQSGTAQSVLASDVREGPLERARGQIAKAGLSDRITLRRTDGLCGITPEEGDVLILTGMGGMLILRILKAGNLKGFHTLVLSPQSDTEAVRRALMEMNLRIEKETLVREDGKYYPVMSVVHGVDTDDHPLHLRYGKNLLPEALPVLAAYLETEYDALSRAAAQIDAHAAAGNAARERREELARACRLNETARRDLLRPKAERIRPDISPAP